MSTPVPDKSPDKISPGKSTEPIDRPFTKPPAGGFESYMQGTPSAPGQQQGAQQTGATGTPSPMELSRGTAFQTAGPSFNTILAQARSAQDTLGTVGQQLKTPNLKLKRSQAHLLKNKLTDAHGYLSAANSKLGIEEEPLELPPGASPIDRFIAYVNDGQDKLLSLQSKLKELAANSEDITPAQMMFIQVKMSAAQQEIEYSSTLLSKVIDSIKTILNTQL